MTTKENNENQSNQMTISNLSLVYFEAFEARLFYISLILFQSQQYHKRKNSKNIVYQSRRTTLFQNDIKFLFVTWWGLNIFTVLFLITS